VSERWQVPIIHHLIQHGLISRCVTLNSLNLDDILFVGSKLNLVLECISYCKETFNKITYQLNNFVKILFLCNLQSCLSFFIHCCAEKKQRTCLQFTAKCFVWLFIMKNKDLNEYAKPKLTSLKIGSIPHQEFGALWFIVYCR